MFNKLVNNKNNKKINSCQKVFETKWFSVDAITYDSSKKEPYYRISSDDSVDILAVTPDQKIILVRQFRPALGVYSLELPAGYINEKESKEAAIQRELKEETGFVCDSISYVGSVRISASRLNSMHHQFFGKGAKKVSNCSDKKEKCKVILVTQDEFKKLIISGKFVNVSGIATYFLAQLKGFL
jgi:8-oxo-dGTP pyrophosphatase MutT (NUDIX family)